MAMGFGDAALDMGGAGLCALDFMRSTALGGGEGILNLASSLSGDALPCFLIVPVGVGAVFMLEYGLQVFFGLTLSGVTCPFLAAMSSLYPSVSYA